MDNPFISCPYNPAHRVLRSRIQGHIVKCEKKYPALKTCQFNASHRYTESELERHLINCPSKWVLSESGNIGSTKLKIVDPCSSKVIPDKTENKIPKNLKIAGPFYRKPLPKVDNDFIEGLYNPTDQDLSQSWQQTDNVKGEKDYISFEVCPFNAAHQFLKSELLRHVVNCPSKGVMGKNENKMPKKLKITGPFYKKPHDIVDDDCWD